MPNTRELFQQAGGLLRTAQLYEAGLTYYELRQLLEAGEIERIRHGWYRYVGQVDDEWQQVLALVSAGVFCLHSAAQLHELSTFVSASYQVAIPWKNRVRLPAYPPIELYYWKDAQYELGQTTLIVNEAEVSVYDREKTVCDFLKARNKVGLEATKEVINHYLARPDHDLTKLMRYAEALGISSVARRFFEILV
jgi:predicted transcriptional regulator of viral defense system